MHSARVKTLALSRSTSQVVRRLSTIALGTPESIRSPILPIVHLPRARYGGRTTVTALPGDGIGPEMLQHVKQIFAYVHAPIDFETIPLSHSDISQRSFESALLSIMRNGVAIKGNVESKGNKNLDPDQISRNAQIRHRLDLFANVLHCVSIPTIPARHKDIDIVIIRENTEGEYSGLEHSAIPGVVESIKIITRPAIERIARFACEYALANNRNKITVVHKANIQKLADGLFLKVARDISVEYPSIKFDSMIVDNASMQLVSHPHQFNGGILLMPNLYGNIIANIACGIVGGPGLISGMNLGDKYAVFETGARNTGTALAGKNLANPTAFIRASIDMLRYLEHHELADRISDALFQALTVQQIHTADVGGTAQSTDIVDAIIDNLRV